MQIINLAGLKSGRHDTIFKNYNSNGGKLLVQMKFNNCDTIVYLMCYLVPQIILTFQIAPERKINTREQCWTKLKFLNLVG